MVTAGARLYLVGVARTPQTVGELLKRMREKRGWSQVIAADKAGITPVWWRRFEKSTYPHDPKAPRLTLDRIERIATKFETSSSELQRLVGYNGHNEFASLIGELASDLPVLPLQYAIEASDLDSEGKQAMHVMLKAQRARMREAERDDSSIAGEKEPEREAQ